jgi:hypothetical protein
VLHEAAVKQLCDAIMLRCVVGSEATFSTLLLEELGEFTASILPTMVRVQTLDVHAMLGVSL